MKVEQLNGANLAFIGDAYYELFIRRHLLEKKITNQKNYRNSQLLMSVRKLIIKLFQN